MEISVNDITLSYEKYGSGPPIIFLHGNGESSALFNDMPSLLNGFTIYLIDSRNHGKSSKDVPISYELMSEDLYQFINALHLEKPIICGFSDGAIVSILVSIKYPNLLQSMILCGPNINPKGIKSFYRLIFRVNHFFTRNPLIKMMLKEPQIDVNLLNLITIPSVIIGGKNDIISQKHLRLIHENIPNSTLIILPNENHFSYVKNNHKLLKLLTNIPNFII